jgi:curved DNA-binding protein CbpA
MALPVGKLKNHFAVLGLGFHAPDDELKKRYRAEVLRCHPDRVPATATEDERASAAARFQEVEEAYRTLSDPDLRRAYEAQLAAQRVSMDPRVALRRHLDHVFLLDDAVLADGA